MSSESDGAASPIEGIHNRVDTLLNKIQSLGEEVERERERREDLEADLDRRDARIDELEERVDELDARTDLLDLVRHADDADAPQRRVALLMHLKRQAESQEDHSIASVDREKAATVLHHPDIDRTTYYDDMREAADLVPDDDVLEYSAGELVLDLDAGPLPGEDVLRQRATERSR